MDINTLFDVSYPHTIAIQFRASDKGVGKKGLTSASLNLRLVRCFALKKLELKYKY